MKLGLIGYGAIGKHVEAAGLENIELVAVLVKRPRNEGLLTHEPDRFFAHRLDAVAECAGHEAVRVHGQRVLESGADFLVTSVGAFTDTDLFDRLLAAAKANGRRLILPSAGIGALDILSSAAVGGLDRVTVTVRKDPSAWKGTIAETLVDLDALKEPQVVFEDFGDSASPFAEPGTLNRMLVTESPQIVAMCAPSSSASVAAVSKP